MRYLFFDIECANCFNGQGKICSFGFVITDTQFNILEQKDILINPRTKFHLQNRKHDKEGIELSYPQQMFLSSPDFNYYYPTIRKLLTEPDQIVFGHSVINDIRFILSDCNRYHKDNFDYNAYDSQILYKLLHKEQTEAALSKLCEAYHVEVTDLHRSDYDAYLTMMVVKGLCDEYKTDLEGLLHLCPNAFYNVHDGEIKNNFATVSNSKKLLEFAKHVKIDRELARATNLRQVNICFSKDFEDKNFKRAMYLVKQLRLRGGYYCSKVKKADYFLKGENECSRSKNLQQCNGIDDVNVKAVEIEEFLQILGVTSAEYQRVDNMSMSSIKSNTSRSHNNVGVKKAVQPK